MHLTMKKRLKLAVMFGGRSVEHEISVITALQAIAALDLERYELIPIYLAPSGKWYTGVELLERSFYRSLSANLARIEEVTLLPDPSIGGVVVLKANTLARVIAIDVCLLAFHGQYGEDGCIQGLLELARLPYTGSGVVAAAVAMHKRLCKSILRDAGIASLPAKLITREAVQSDFTQTLRSIFYTPGLEQFPLFIKPCNLGSSIGVSRADDQPALAAAIAKALRYDSEVMIEPCLTPLVEINVSVIDGNPPRASVVEVPLSDAGVLTFEDKYLRPGGKKGSSASEGMASLTRLIDPSNLDPAIKERVRLMALRAFTLLGASGVVRFDFMLNPDTGELYFNELNSIPGSFAFYLWEKSDPLLLYTDLLDQLLETALDRASRQLTLERSLEFRALTR